LLLARVIEGRYCSIIVWTLWWQKCL